MKFTKLEKSQNIKENVIRPFVFTRPSVSEVCIKIFILLFLQFLCLIFTKSFSAVFVILVSTFGAVCAAVLNYFIRKEPFYNYFTIILQGIITGMLLPQSFPLVPVFFISFLTLFLSRTFIFKNVNSWINESAFAVIVAWFIGNTFFPSFMITPDLIFMKNPSEVLIQSGNFPVYHLDHIIIDFLNNSIFGALNISVPEGFISLLWDTNSIVPAFRFNILTIFASIILFSDDSFSILIPSIFLFTYGILVRFFGPMVYGGQFNQGDILLAMLTGGTLFFSVFMIQWWGTTPVSVFGKIIFALITGALAFGIMGCGTSPVGMVYTVLISNIVNIIIRHFEERKTNILLERLALKTSKK